MPDDATPVDAPLAGDGALARPAPSAQGGPVRGFDVLAAAAEVRAAAEPAFDPAAGPSDPSHPDAPAWAAWYAEQAQAVALSSDPDAIAWAAWYAERAAACGYDPTGGKGPSAGPVADGAPPVAPAPDPFVGAPASPDLAPVDPVEFGVVSLPEDEVLEVGTVVVEVDSPSETAAAAPDPASAPPASRVTGAQADGGVAAAPPSEADLLAIMAAFDGAPSGQAAADPADPAAARAAPPGLEPATDRDPSLELELTRSWGEAAAPVVGPPACDPAAFVAGVQRVVVHLADGVVLRGTLRDAALDAATVDVTAADGIQRVDTAEIKAIFFMQPPGAPGPAPTPGDVVRVTFRDGRQVTGTSGDHQDGRAGFFVTPVEARSPTARVWIYSSAVRDVAVASA